jgi:hypothetical protein
VICVDHDVAARIQIDTELLNHSFVHRMDKTHREQNELGLEFEFAPGHFHHLHLALLIAFPFDLNAVQFADLSVFSGEFFRQNTVLDRSALFMGGRVTENARPFRPRIAALGTPAVLKETIRGDVVWVTTVSPDILSAGLKERFDVDAVVQDGAVRFERDRAHELIPQIVVAFPDLVASASVGKPTLEDVFVHHTGHRFWADNGGPS